MNRPVRPGPGVRGQGRAGGRAGGGGGPQADLFEWTSLGGGSGGGGGHLSQTQRALHATARCKRKKEEASRC